MLQLLSFHLHLDFSGIFWGFTNLVQGVVGVITGFIGGMIALFNRKGSYRKTFQKGLSILYGAIIPSVGAVTGFTLLMVHENDRTMKKFLDGIALFPLVAGIVGMIIFITIRNRRVVNSAKDNLY